MYLFIYTELGRYMNLTYTLLLELFRIDTSYKR